MVEYVPSVREVSSMLMSKSDTVRKTCGMLDSGAPRTVCGAEWMLQWSHPNAYEDRIETSAKTFKFGDGRAIRSLGWVNLDGEAQYQNDSKRWITHTDIIPGELQLLISMSCMKSWGGCLDMKKDRLITDSGIVDLAISPSGHILVPIQPHDHGVLGRNEKSGGEELGVDAKPVKNPCEVTNTHATCNVIAVGESGDSISAQAVSELRRHLGHVSANVLQKISSKAGRVADFQEIKM